MDLKEVYDKLNITADQVTELEFGRDPKDVLSADSILLKYLTPAYGYDQDGLFWDDFEARETLFTILCEAAKVCNATVQKS